MPARSVELRRIKQTAVSDGSTKVEREQPARPYPALADRCSERSAASDCWVRKISLNSLSSRDRAVNSADGGGNGSCAEAAVVGALGISCRSSGKCSAYLLISSMRPSAPLFFSLSGRLRAARQVKRNLGYSTGLCAAPSVWSLLRHNGGRADGGPASGRIGLTAFIAHSGSFPCPQ